MPDLNDDLNAALEKFEDEASELVKELFGKNGYKTAIRELTQQFRDDAEDDIRRYVQARSQLLISDSDFEILLKTKAALLRLNLLTGKGLTELQAERFRRRFMHLLTNTLLDMAEILIKAAIA